MIISFIFIIFFLWFEGLYGKEKLVAGRSSRAKGLNEVCWFFIERFSLFHLTAQKNVTISSTPYHQLVECKCSDCKDSDWRCYAELGCFSVLKQDENDNYVVSKGCFENALHRKINCENPVTPAVCCEENMCNWNVTPTFPTKKSSKCQLLIIDSCGGIFLCMH